MDRLIATSSRRHSLLSTHKVLRNTYFLLSFSLAFSALSATAGTLVPLPAPALFLMLVGFFT
ncbi:FtsH protease modulator YccA, partial [Sodalis-like symbiont of Bactericera trigonica]